MTYFKINGVDFSTCANNLEVQTNHIYNSRTNSNGDTVVKYINSKRIVTVGIIPLNEHDLAALTTEIGKFKVTLEYRDPNDRALKTIDCIIPKNNIAYYTIRADKIQTKAFNLMFEEL